MENNKNKKEDEVLFLDIDELFGTKKGKNKIQMKVTDKPKGESLNGFIKVDEKQSDKG